MNCSLKRKKDVGVCECVRVCVCVLGGRSYDIKIKARIRIVSSLV